MDIFVDKEEPYLAWVSSNPDGYVLNCHRSPDASYLMLHQATCGQIRSPKRTNYTTGQYMKACALYAEELRAWALQETGGALQHCGLCRPSPGKAAPSEQTGTGKRELRREDVRGFECWIRGYQNFYEPIVLAYFRDLRFQAHKPGSTIERADLLVAAQRLEDGSRKCELKAAEKQRCIEHFRKRTRIQTDGILEMRAEDGDVSVYSVECKSWGGFCSPAGTLEYFRDAGGWFMLVDSIRGKKITGSVLVIGGRRTDNPKHDDWVSQLSGKFQTEVQIHYLRDIFARPRQETKDAIADQLARLDLCVESIKKDLRPEDR